MSMRTWKKEFYPIHAREATHSTLEALQHSLRKWEGLTEKNLEKHGLFRYGAIVHEIKGEDSFRINDHTCALCHLFLVVPTLGEHQCMGCPLYELRGYPCDRGEKAPYFEFIEDDRIEPMINLLKLAIRHINPSNTKISGD